MRRYAVYDWSIEQKWVMMLLPLLILYNSKSLLTFLSDPPDRKCLSRSPFPLKFPVELMVSWHVGRHISGEFSLLAPHVLAVLIPRLTANRTAFLLVLFTQNRVRGSNLALCRYLSHLGKVQ